jgi:hypothetical protein|eukprot:gene9691-6934_t
MELSPETLGIDANSSITLNILLEGSRKRPFHGNFSHFSSLALAPSSATATNVSPAGGSERRKSYLPSTLKRSKRSLDLTALGDVGEDLGTDEHLRPVAVDLAAVLASQPIDDNDAEGATWESAGLFISSDGGSGSESEDVSRSSVEGRSTLSSRPSLSGGDGLDDGHPPAKMRRNSADGGAFDSWIALQRGLDMDEPRRRSSFFSIALSAQPPLPPFDLPRSCLPPSTVGALSGSSNYAGASQFNGGYNYKHARKLPSLASLVKKPATRMLSSAASAAASAAVQSHHASSVASKFSDALAHSSVGGSAALPGDGPLEPPVDALF